MSCGRRACSHSPVFSNTTLDFAFRTPSGCLPAGKQPEGVRNAKSRVVLENTGEWLQALLPQDMDNYLSQLLKKRKDDQDQPEGPPGQRSDAGSPDVTGSVRQPANYQRSDRTDMRQLIDATRR